MQFQEFQNFALTTEQANNIAGGSWKAVRNSLMSNYGTKVMGMSSETQSSFNPITGQMAESNMISLTIEFANGTGTTVDIHKDDYDLCCKRIRLIFKF